MSAGIIGGLASAVIVPAIIGALAFAIGRARPLALNATSGTIAPDLITAVVTVALGLLIAAGGFLALVVGHPSGVKFGGLCAIIFGLGISAFMSPSLTKLHAVSWSPAGVEGPSALFGPTLGLARTFIPWSEIITTGETSTSYWFIEARDRRRIYWSYLYRGHGRFGAAIQANCPQLSS